MEENKVIYIVVEGDTHLIEVKDIGDVTFTNFDGIVKNEVEVSEEGNYNDTNMLIDVTDTEKKNSEITTKFDETYKFKKRHRGKCDLCNGSKKIVKAYACSACEYATVRSRDLKRHINIMHNFKTTAVHHKCDFCDFKSTKYQLKRHMEVSHQRTIILKCPQCYFYSYEKQQLILHIAEAHMNFESFKCKLCPYTSKVPSHLKYHINNTHLNAKLFICDICCFSTTKKSSLKVHIECVHLGTEYFNCSFCDYSTTKKCYLQSHLNDVHLKLKSFMCHICGLVMARKQHLKFHIDRVHLKSIDKANKCDKCTYCTWKKSDLKRHAKVHVKSENLQ